MSSMFARVPCSALPVEAHVKANSPPGFNSCIILLKDSLYCGSCSKHSLETIVSKRVDRGISFVLHTKFTLGASITSLLIYIQSVKRCVLLPPPTSSTILLSKIWKSFFNIKKKSCSFEVHVCFIKRRDNE